MLTGMSDIAPSFENLFTPTARLVSCEEPPELDDLNLGDFVVCSTGWGIDEYAEEAKGRGIHVLHGEYRYQNERVISKTAKRRSVIRGYTPLSGHDGETPPHSEKETLQNATDAFAATWDSLSTDLDLNPHFEDATGLVPAPWLSYLPFPALNPAQAQTAPHITDSDRSVVVTAPTGAGKTVIGMMAVLKAILDKGKKAAWLVPQRSLTAELDQELEAWRGQGLKIVALSGETATDTEKTKDADLWVATTEKFEALCRSSSMRETIAEIDTIVVDEIHLLGDPSRGAVLETLLARVGAEKLPVRVVGLSATAANAAAVADWLNADLVPISWRPTRQTQQMLMVPSDTANGDARNRNTVCANIVADVSRNNGSTIIFCGTKAKVRSAALAIARSRGVDVNNADPSDNAAVHAAAHEAGVGLHYSDWPHKKQAEKEFRDHTSDVLVATSTLAAGVNLPARAVIVRDTTIGQNWMEVSMVQQMFGRAGRAGKEAEGWSFLIADPYEIGHWRKKLADGYAIRSGLTSNLADHLLGEIVQGNVTSLKEGERWWEHTFAHHEGESGSAELTKARDTLDKFGFIKLDTEQDPVDPKVSATRLGQITSRMMVSVSDARGLIAALNGKEAPATPKNANQAEDLLIRTVADQAYALSNAQAANGTQAPMVRRVLDSRGDVNNFSSASKSQDRGGQTSLKGNYVSQAGLFLALRSPNTFAAKGGQVAGINRSLFNPAIYDSPRIFAWLTAVGSLKAVPPWASAVALDLGARITWKTLLPKRGDGRLLAAMERTVPATRANRLVPALFQESKRAGVSTPARLTATAAPDGVAQSRLQTTAQKTVRLEDGSFSKGVTAFVALDGKKWAPIKAGEKIGNRLAVGFHASGDASGTGWLEVH